MNLTNYIHQRLETRRILLMTHAIIGYPSLEANWQMLEIMQEAGVDMVELQMPFSEPVADGPVFARANQEAIKRGIKLEEYFQFMQRAAAAFDFPLLMMGYYNTVFRMGHQAFCQRLQECGAAGFIVPDLPFDEYGDLEAASNACQLSPILLMTPTNTVRRLEEIGERAAGLVYVVARKGVTGQRTDLDQGLDAFLGRCRRATQLPLALGFGLGNAADMRRLQGQVEMGIVGSALLEAWDSGGAGQYRDLLQELGQGRG
ncbi:MAG: tryptophan synthase subunit alpha [Candidatus Latescibacteria bacterium]|nr:tryptophan synthase subunit alpha [Candidatus Latescibacterota bacterium]